MRERTSVTALLTMAASGLVLAGCVDNAATTSPSASAGAPTAGAAAGGPVAGCVTGKWRTTAVNTQAASGASNASLSGGGGVAVTVGANGETTIDFSKMRPVSFTTTALGSEVSGQFTFAGQVSGTVRTGTGTGTSASESPTTGASTAGASVGPTTGATAGPASSPANSPATGAGDQSGTWEPVPPIDWADTRVTVDLLKPMKVRPVENVKIADYVADGASQTGNVVDIEPLLGKGSYQCQGDNLVLTPDDGGMGWTLTRA
jgi:hypothetical protein